MTKKEPSENRKMRKEHLSISISLCLLVFQSHFAYLPKSIELLLGALVLFGILYLHHLMRKATALDSA